MAWRRRPLVEVDDDAALNEDGMVRVVVCAALAAVLCCSAKLFREGSAPRSSDTPASTPAASEVSSTDAAPAAAAALVAGSEATSLYSYIAILLYVYIAI